jgi:hypothetical protein
MYGRECGLTYLLDFMKTTASGYRSKGMNYQESMIKSFAFTATSAPPLKPKFPGEMSENHR